MKIKDSEYLLAAIQQLRGILASAATPGHRRTAKRLAGELNDVLESEQMRAVIGTYRPQPGSTTR